LAGGRYDGLVEQMGGRPTPGIGWAAGVERLAMMVGEAPPEPRPVVVIPIGEEAEREALAVTQELRRAGFVTEMGYSGNMKKRINRANKANASAVVILGEDELAKDVATVRDMETGEQAEAPLASLVDHLVRYR
ncbi:MAG: His/Gly/Thr/Pro-type tRNA ligase C-terminal domain-containing protein, partial [Magnetovibrio sp.]|nr:His/Gly/Thr/Pro-type tRNA ligase C-terminal domain-containing protein [Magnetovibrio sp.]